MALYPHSIASIRELIKMRFPIAEAKECNLDMLMDERIMCEHILWILKKVENMLPAEKGRAGRWMGRAVAYLEVMGFLTNTQTMDLMRVDVRNLNS